MDPLGMFTLQEYKAVVQQLLADMEDLSPEIETIEDNELGDSTEFDILTPPLHSDLEDIS